MLCTRSAGLLFLFMVGACTNSNDAESSAAGWTPPADAQRLVTPSPPPADVATLVTGNSAFAAGLHKQLAATPGNVIYSPYGVSLNMAELDSASSQPNIGSTLDFTLPVDRLNVAFDALDLDLGAISGKTESGQGLQFEETSAAWGTLAGGGALAEYYGTQVLTGKDPGQVMATWQAAVTPGPVIPVALIGACDGFLVTLVNFDAAWQTDFDPSATRPGSFTRTDGSTATASMMNQEALASVQSSGPTRAIELPYDGGRLAMLIVVPDDLATFEGTFTADTIPTIESGLISQNVQLALPKFSATYAWNVLEVLKTMGWTPSGGGAWAIGQSASIHVSETGTQATATTATSHSPSAVAIPVPFAVDRPFAFFIRDRKTGSILFGGRIVDPTLSP